MTHEQLRKSYTSVARNIIIKGKGVSCDRAQQTLESILDPSFLRTNKQCVLVGSCYNANEGHPCGMLRVLEWVDDAEAGLNLHCK